ncbi:lanthionine synthetase LanC family protein [Sphingobacterium sp. G1-14]|uniref:lanthionine synthetase LanC family protein n=1 Tax=Sphingobacterium TaxID=28453 RepID=UPI000B48C2FD|nr:lanthionine synthetase LanC family protein [Sphingobacterium sp. G1-14]
MNINLTDIYTNYSGFLIENYLNDTGVNPAIKRENSINDARPFILLYLLEIYTINKSVELKDVIDKEFQNILLCNDKLENDYSLKSGIGLRIYILIKKYELDHDDRYIEKAIDLIKGADYLFLESPYTSNGLMEGRSGFLVLLIKLHKITKQDDLNHYIEKFLLKILEETKFDENGCYWTESYTEFCSSDSLINGTLGIFYALKYFESYFGDIFINNLVQEFNIKLPSQEYVHDGQETNIIVPINSENELENQLKQILIKNSYIKEDSEVFNCFQNIDFQLFINKLNNQILSACARDWTLDQDSLFGDKMLTTMYYHIKTTASPICDDSIYPFFLENTQFPDSKGAISLDLSSLNLRRLKTDFPKTTMVANAIDKFIIPSYLIEYCPTIYKSQDSQFAGYIDRITKINSGIHPYIVLKEALEIDLKRLEVIAQHNFWQSDVSKSERFKYVTKLLDQPENWLSDQKLIISTAVKFLKTQFDWKDAIFESGKDLLNLPAAKTIVIFTSIDNRQVDEIYLEHDFLLFLDLFRDEVSVQDALNQIYSILNTLEEEKLLQISKNIGLTNIYNKADFLYLFKNTIFMTLRKWIQLGILTFSAA